MYTFGPFLVGIAASSVELTHLLQTSLVFLFVYFLFPANLLIYGVNDAFDTDTDLVNEKKDAYETRLDSNSRLRTLIIATLINIPFVVAVMIIAPFAVLPLAAFLFLSIFYSAPPIRAKSKPVLDSAFNILYVLPGVISYATLTGDLPSVQVIAAAGAWTAAMHAYSAIPDMDADTAAGVPTIATFLGATITLLLCASLIAVASTLSFKYLGYLSVALGLVYILMIAASFKLLSSEGIFRVYRVFPLVNTAAGFTVFWYIVLVKH